MYEGKTKAEWDEIEAALKITDIPEPKRNIFKEFINK